MFQIDSREKARAIKKILHYFDQNGIGYYISKLYIGDYMSLDNPRVVVDRKQNLSEVYQNLCHQAVRIGNEMARAKASGIQLIFLVEHGPDVRKLADVAKWHNPRLDATPYAWSGEYLAQRMYRAERMHGVKWEFCQKADTGRRIVELLGGAHDG